MRTSYGANRIVSGENDIQCRPTQFAGDRRPVIYVHGAGELCEGWMNVPSRCPIMNKVAASGRIIYSADLGGKFTWGNDTAIERINSVYNYIQAQSGVVKGKVHVLCQSMGALNAMCWARGNIEKLASMVSIIAVTNLTDVWQNSSSDRGNIESAYGGSYTEAAYGDYHNPITIARESRMPFFPHQQWYGTSDTLCKPEFAIEYGNLTNTVKKPIAGGHEDSTITKVSINEVLQFFDQNDG